MITRKIIPLFIMLLLQQITLHAQIGEIIVEGLSLLGREGGEITLSQKVGAIVSESGTSIKPSRLIPFLKENSYVIENNNRISFNKWYEDNRTKLGKAKGDLWIAPNKETKLAFDLIDDQTRDDPYTHITIEQFESTVIKICKDEHLPANGIVNATIYRAIRKHFAAINFEKTSYFTNYKGKDGKSLLTLFQIDNGFKVTGTYSEETISALLKDSGWSALLDLHGSHHLHENIFNNFEATYNAENKYIKYLITQKYLPSGLKKYPKLDVRIGLLKLQKAENLLLTGDFDYNTIELILSKYYPNIINHYPNWKNHLLPPKLPFDFLPDSTDNVWTHPLKEITHRIIYSARSSGVGFTKLDPTGNYIFSPTFFQYGKDSLLYFSKLSIFINQIPEDLSSFQKTLFVFTYKATDKRTEYLTTIFPQGNQLIGYTEIIKFDKYKNLWKEQSLNTDIQYLKEKGLIDHIIWSGDKVTATDVTALADKNKVHTLRRSPYVNKPLSNAITSDGISFNSEQALVCNGLPTNKDELAKTGFTLLGLDGWIKYYNEVNEKVKGHFKEAIRSKDDFKNILINGAENVLLVVAHSDGMKMFIGGETVSIDEIKSWPQRTTSSNEERVIVLLVCEASNENLKTGLLFKQRVASFSELLLNQGYADRIIAPEHEIPDTEALSILQGLIDKRTIKELRQQFPGWGEHVENIYYPLTRKI
ncbi:hypothetical protein [Chitinophaga sp.]|uniref:hypothetical protein n=1 Tax=Chitinophaga sp. TaxID=1869181 RepID=UPI0031E2DA4B